MNTSRRIFSVLLALVMMLGTFTMAIIPAAAAENDTVTVTLTGKDLGIDTTINTLDLTFVANGEATVDLVNVAAKAPFDGNYTEDTASFMASSVEAAEIVIELTVKVTGEAGKTADLVISGTASVYNNGTFTDSAANATVALSVDGVAAYNAAVAATTALDERAYTAESWAALENALNAPVGKDIAAATASIVAATAALAKDIDYSALNDAIETAETLKQSEYTVESWSALTTALTAAKAVVANGAEDQAAANAALKSLTAAIAALVSDVDYSALNDAIATAEALKESEYTTESWAALTAALTAAKAVVAGGVADQTAVNAALKTLTTAIAGLKAPVVVLPDDETETTDSEETTVATEEPKWQSPVWPVLFFVFLALTLALAALIVVYLVLKKKKENDDTPVIDYNIEDDEAEVIGVEEETISETIEGDVSEEKPQDNTTDAE